MKKVWGIILVVLGIGSAVYAADFNEWHHIIQATKKVSTDKEVQQAVQDAVIATQRALSLTVKKIASQVSPSEKAILAEMVKLLKQMSEKYYTMVKRGNFDNVDAEGQEELREMSQELMNLVIPVMFLMQDPRFVNEQKAVFQNTYVRVCENIKQTMTQLHNDLK